jgi:hypothetical protein
VIWDVPRTQSAAHDAALCAELGITEADLAVLRARTALPASADEWLTVEEICAELKITRRTFDRWRQLGRGPRCERIGGHGPLRSRRSWVDAWMLGAAEAAR